MTTYVGLVHICPILHKNLYHFGMTISSSLVKSRVAILLRKFQKMNEIKSDQMAINNETR